MLDAAQTAQAGILQQCQDRPGALSSCLGMATSLQAAAKMGECTAHAGFNGALEEGSSCHSFCAGLVCEETWSATLARGYRRAHCRGIISTSSSLAPWPLQQLLQSCSWALQCSRQGAIPQEHGRLRRGCQIWADVPRAST